MSRGGDRGSVTQVTRRKNAMKRLLSFRWITPYSRVTPDSLNASSQFVYHSVEHFGQPEISLENFFSFFFNMTRPFCIHLSAVYQEVNFKEIRMTRAHI